MIETAKFASVVLPSASSFEKSGTSTNGARAKENPSRTEIRLVEREMLR